MKIKMKMGVNGTFHNIDAGVVVGQVVDIEDAEALRYIALGYAEVVKPGHLSEEHAVAAFSNEERAVLSKDIVGASHGAVPQSKVAKSVEEAGSELVVDSEPAELDPKVAAALKTEPKIAPNGEPHYPAMAKVAKAEPKSEPEPVKAVPAKRGPVRKAAGK